MIMSEQHAISFVSVELMVSPDGRFYAVGGYSKSPEGTDQFFDGYGYIKDRIDKLQSRLVAMEAFIRTCKYYLKDGEPVYQFSVEALDNLQKEKV